MLVAGHKYCCMGLTDSGCQKSAVFPDRIDFDERMAARQPSVQKIATIELDARFGRQKSHYSP